MKGPSEAEFTQQVLQLLSMYGWLAIHQRPARTMSGWRTATQGNGAKGFPDIVAVRERVLWIELKTEKGELSLAQEHWIRCLHEAGQTVFVWSPSDWPEIEATLQL